MQEEVDSKTVALVINSAKLTGRLFIAAIRKFLEHNKNKNAVIPHGKQTVKQLIGQNQGVSALEIGDGTFKDFFKCANKVGVDYAITVDKSVEPKRYTVFFKARDADALEEVMKNYAQRTMSREKRPSVIKLLNKMKEKVASIPHKVKQRTKQKEQSR